MPFHVYQSLRSLCCSLGASTSGSQLNPGTQGAPDSKRQSATQPVSYYASNQSFTNGSTYLRLRETLPPQRQNSTSALFQTRASRGLLHAEDFALLIQRSEDSSTARPLSNEADLERHLSKIKSGILAKHLIAVRDLANTTNTIVGFRPVNWAAKALIEAGYPTKNFHIKTKTAKWGPQIGHLCPGPHESIDPAFAKPGPLLLSQARVDELLARKVIEPMQSMDGASPETFRFSACDTDKQTHHFLATKSQGGAGLYSPDENTPECWQISKLSNTDSGHSEPIEVLCCPHTHKPLTADYDLLTYGRPKHLKGKADNQPLLAVGSFSKLLESRHSIRHSVDGGDRTRGTQSSPGVVAPREDPHKGNVAAFTRQLIKGLNGLLNRGPSLNLIHHNIEAHSPFPQKETDIYPAVFCLPNPQARNLLIEPHELTAEAHREINELMRLNSQEPEKNKTSPWLNRDVVTVRNPQELTRLAAEARVHGYQFEVAATWLGGHLRAEGEHQGELEPRIG